MKKKISIVIIIFVLILGIYGVFHFNNKEEIKENENIKNNVEENIEEINVEELINKIYSNVSEGTLPELQIEKMELNDIDIVEYATGLTSIENIEEIYRSEPMMSSQAYSLIVVKLKDSSSAEEIQTEMMNNVNPRKWICVTAEKICSISKGNIVALVMASDEWATPVFESMKKELSGGKEENVTVEDDINLDIPEAIVE